MDNILKLFTSKNLTRAGIALIVATLAEAGFNLWDGDPTTVVNYSELWKALVLGAAMIMGKGQASTGGTVPTPGTEAVERVKLNPV